MQEKIQGHKQTLLHESTLVAGERDLERPPCRTPILTPMRQEEEEKGLFVMHAMADDIQCCIQGDPTQVELSKEKARSHSPMSLDSDVASRQQQACRLSSIEKK